MPSQIATGSIAGIESELGLFSQDQKRLIYQNLYAIELTDGCSVGCGFCGFDVPGGVRDAIPFHALEQIADEAAALTDRAAHARASKALPKVYRSDCSDYIFLYDGSEPLDYWADGKDYFDAFDLFSAKGFKVATSSAIPKGKEELAIANLDNIHQISISHMNRARLMPYFDRLGVAVFVDLLNLYRAKFGGWSYSAEAPIRQGCYKVRSSIQETVAEIRKIDPSLPKKYRFYDLRVDGNRLRRNVQDLKTLFLFCGNPGEFARHGKIVDRDDAQVRNVGRAYAFEHYEREYPNDPIMPFGATNGVKITPRGIYNTLCVQPSEENKVGKIIEKSSFQEACLFLYLTRC